MVHGDSCFKCFGFEPASMMVQVFFAYYVFITIFANLNIRTMKYTNYIINGDVINAKTLESMPKIFLPVSLAVAILGVVLLAGAIPATLTIDGVRSLKCQMIRFERRYHYGQSIVQNKAFRFVVVKPIKIVVISPITNVLKFVA